MISGHHFKPVVDPFGVRRRRANRVAWTPTSAVRTFWGTYHEAPHWIRRRTLLDLQTPGTVLPRRCGTRTRPSAGDAGGVVSYGGALFYIARNMTPIAVVTA